MNLDEQKINGVGLVHVIDSLNAPLLKIKIYRDENTVVPNNNDLIVYVDKNDSANQTENLRQYVFELQNPLRYFNQVSDEFVFDYITKDNDIFLKAVVKRYIGVNNDVPYILDEVIEEEIECLPITLFEGENYIYTNYGNSIIETIYPKNNDLNKMYLSDAMFYVHKLKNDGEFYLDDIYFKDAFTKTEDKLNLEVNNINIDCITSRNNSFSLDDDGNLIVNTINSNSGNLYNDESIVNLIYPVGSIYMSINDVNPSTLFGGVWERIAQGKTLVGVDTTDNDFNTVEKIGGSKINSHSHYTLTSFDGNSLYVGSSGNTDGGSRVVNKYRANYSGGTKQTAITREDATYKTNISIVQPYYTCYIWKRTN